MDRTGLLGKIRKIFSIKFWKDRLAQLKSKTEMPRWKIRRKFWNIWTWLKFVTKSPMKISYPNRRKDRLELVVITKMIKGLDGLTKDTPYKVPDRFPSDEKPFPGYWVKMAVFWLQARLCRNKWSSPMQNGLPQIHKDPQWALDNAYSERGENLCARPKLPPVFYDSPDLDSPDLGDLAVRGPYACYLEKVKEKDDVYQWDLLEKLKGYTPHSGLYKLGVKVLFRKVGDRLEAYEIETPELGSLNLDKVSPGDENWKLGKKIALCTLTNHTSLIRHWSWIHLIPATQLAFATRTKLGPDHPLRRLLWPHIYGTVQATKFGTMAQMAKGGDFENVFSFPHEQMCKLFNDSYKDFRLYRSVPKLDLEARRIRIEEGKDEFSMPTHKNLQELFTIIHCHIKRYLIIFYNDPNIGEDPELLEWLNELNTMPGGIREVLRLPTNGGLPQPIVPNDVTFDNVARLVASFIYLSSVQHEMMGSLLWNYQLWTHRQPTRVYKNGEREPLEPLDVYQRLVNYNFMLMVKRTHLMDESTYCRMTKGLPKDEKGKLETCYRQFVSELENLQSKMDAEPWEAWRIYPKDLEAHINA